MFDDHAKKAREVIDVPWDEVRAARVHKKALEAFKLAEEEALAEDVERELADDATSQSPSDDDVHDTIPMVGSRRRWLVVALAAAAAVALWLVGSKGLLGPGAAPGEGAVAMTWQAASTLEYTDGSRSLLAERAEVQVVDDRDEHVEVEQRGGLVRYEIAKRPERRFVVEARDVTVTVLGTVFEVDVAGDEVTVSVQRGRVRVEHGATDVELTTGQRIALTAPSSSSSSRPTHGVSRRAARDPAEDPGLLGSILGAPERRRPVGRRRPPRGTARIIARRTRASVATPTPKDRNVFDFERGRVHRARFSRAARDRRPSPRGCGTWGGGPPPPPELPFCFCLRPNFFQPEICSAENVFG